VLKSDAHTHPECQSVGWVNPLGHDLNFHISLHDCTPMSPIYVTPSTRHLLCSSSLPVGWYSFLSFHMHSLSGSFAHGFTYLNCSVLFPFTSLVFPNTELCHLSFYLIVCLWFRSQLLKVLKYDLSCYHSYLTILSIFCLSLCSLLGTGSCCANLRNPYVPLLFRLVTIPLYSYCVAPQIGFITIPLVV